MREFKIGDIIIFKDMLCSLLSTKYIESFSPWLRKKHIWLAYPLPWTIGTAIITNIIADRNNYGNYICQLLFNNNNGIRYIYGKSLHMFIESGSGVKI